ncbi:S8 family serine peptidase [Streptomyces sp. A7024]|uniref:S8 family serine peptidase n=1 Tax=Streptomyces coryli TaxID=1128680 RepID=A0A6G4TWL0_9ACTN|nr:S8 family serine peptidase [Streptomyces coryli]NGN64203.1 S8 family serine peptidase [Streptomyces coryli]
MTHPRPRWTRMAAASTGLALTVALGFLPGSASADAARDAEVAAAGAKAAGDTLPYLVNADTDRGTTARVTKAIAAADGKLVKAYERIGVFIVHSANADFAKELRGVRGVDSAGAARTAPLKPAWTDEDKEGAPKPYSLADAPKAAADQEPLEPEQWDLRAIKSDKANKINPGSKKVTVGVIDTGVDDTHPDLAPNFSKSQSANCVGGVADTSDGAWRPYTSDAYHGTHVAGEVAAARNGVGVAGVAPGVKVASIKVSEPDTQLFFPESVVCAFVFAADHGIEITNNSYYVDPWLYNCKDDPDQRAIVDAVGRASAYAQKKGLLNVASAGNSNHDLDSDAIVDDSSPDDTTPVERTIDPSECWDIPTQLPGVATVSATGVQDLKSYYSTYGKGWVDVAAPGGDKYQIPDNPSKNGRILSTMPDGAYAWLQGTSMAAPHVSGVAALLKSTHPYANGAQLQQLLKAQADNPGCPEFYDPDGNGVEDSTCEGSKRSNGFYGKGIVDALDAVR